MSFLSDWDHLLKEFLFEINSRPLCRNVAILRIPPLLFYFPLNKHSPALIMRLHLPHLSHISRLSVSAEREGVAALPAGSPGSTNALVGTVALLGHTTGMTTNRGQTTALAVLHHGVHNPVDGRVVADGVVSRIDQNDLEVLVGGILIHPVAVQHTQVLADATNTALSNRAEIALVLQSDNTLVLGLSIHNTLGIGSLASSTADSNTINNVALLGLHSQSASLVGASGVSNTADLRKLAILPGTNSEHVTHGIALLLSPELLKILVSTHDESVKINERVLRKWVEHGRIYKLFRIENSRKE